MRLLKAVAVLLLLHLLGCGDGVPRSEDLTVTIEPPSATITVGTVLPVKGNGRGFTDTPLVGWWVEETTRSNSTYCGTDYDERPPDTAACPCGYVMFNKSDTGVPSTGYYHAPAEPKVCHVRFQASQYQYYELKASSGARAEITIIP